MFDADQFNIYQESMDDEVEEEEEVDEAGYETDEYFDEQGRKVTETDYGDVSFDDSSVSLAPKQEPVPVTVVSRNAFGCQIQPKRTAVSAFTEDDCYNNVSFETAWQMRARAEFRYTMADMAPTIRDPRCSSSTELACFWPVYVGNFKNSDVAKYFASKGLHVRWYYRREDGYFREFQKKAGLYDMLVYFVSERDAQLAIERCHRDEHRGYTLNVFPGREPVYFREDRSVVTENMKRGHIYSEHFLEKHVRIVCGMKVNCVVKFDMANGALEFFKPHHVKVVRKRGKRRSKLWKYQPVKGNLQKQRFLEKDVIKDIEAKLATDPTVLKIKQNDQYMQMLLAGHRPVYDAGKRYPVVPLRRGPGKKTQKSLREKKLRRLMKKYGVDGR